MNKFSFVALDVETATGCRSSICEIGVTVVEDSEVKESKSWLIQPKENLYWRRNIDIHGITPKDTCNKAYFSEVWGEINPYIKGKVIVTHNTSFDMYAIAEALTENNIPLPNLDYFCSLRIAQRTFSLLKYSLAPLCNSLGIPLEQHHRAASDSEACAKVMLRCLEELQVSSFDELEQKIKIKRGSYKDGLHNGQQSLGAGSGKKKYSNTADPTNFDPNNYFYEKEVLFTGEMKYGNRETMRALVDNIGGHSIDRFKKTVDILVEGTQTARNLNAEGKSKKQIECEKKLANGGSVEILSEDEFYERFGIWNEEKQLKSQQETEALSKASEAFGNTPIYTQNTITSIPIEHSQITDDNENTKDTLKSSNSSIFATPDLDESLCYDSYEDYSSYVSESARKQPQPVVRRSPKRNYRMVDEQRPQAVTTAHPEENETHWIAYVFAALALIALCVLLFASLGFAVFFLPLLAGKFKK